MLCIVLRVWSLVVIQLFFFFKQKTAYEMRISDWSSDVCSSDLCRRRRRLGLTGEPGIERSRLHHLHRKSHERVGGATVFGAGPAIAAGLDRLQHQARGATGDDVHLAAPSLKPERAEDSRVGEESVSTVIPRWVR